jgi:hypothetical protein
MRKNKIYSWVISMALAFGVVLAGCDNGNSGVAVAAAFPRLKAN